MGKFKNKSCSALHKKILAHGYTDLFSFELVYPPRMQIQQTFQIYENSSVTWIDETKSEN